jgi:hypothetical protein
MKSFSQFKTLEIALKQFRITYEVRDIFPDLQLRALKVAPQSLVDEINFNMTEMPYETSEASICEMIIFPILKNIWTNFRNNLLLWSHKSIGQETDLSGIPDYILAKRSILGKAVMDLPMMVMIEAKKDDFDGGWGQCLAQMMSAREINQSEHLVYGIVSNGDSWQFAYLSENKMSKHLNPISVGDMGKLYTILYYIFDICEQQILQKNNL